MAKIIRTVHLSGPVVNLGQTERDLALRDAETETGGFDLGGLLENRVEALCRQMEERHQREKEELQVTSEQRIQEAEIHWKKEREQLYQQRYEEGYQAGIEARETEVKEAVARLDAVHQALKQLRAQVLLGTERLVVDLAMACARRIVGFQVEHDSRVLVRVIRAALEQLSQRGELEIKVHPDDLQLARRFAQKWVEKVEQDAVLKVAASEHVERGGCMLEGREENLDARLKEQLRLLHKALHQAVEVHAPDAGPLASDREMGSEEGE